jgi:hypothetical protein
MPATTAGPNSGQCRARILGRNKKVCYLFFLLIFYFTKGSLTTTRLHVRVDPTVYATTTTNNDNNPTATNNGLGPWYDFFLTFFCFTNDYLQLQATYMYGTGLQEPRQRQQNHDDNDNEWPPPSLPTNRASRDGTRRRRPSANKKKPKRRQRLTSLSPNSMSTKV